jgi:hypothetical protein
MNRLADHVVAAEGKRDIADTARDLRARAYLLDPPRGFQEIDRIVVVLVDSRRDGQDVGVEDDVLGPENRPVRQNLERAAADADLVVRFGRLARSSKAITTTAAP